MNIDMDMLLLLQKTNINRYIEAVSLGVMDWIMYSLFFLSIFCFIFYAGYKKGEFDMRYKKEIEDENSNIPQKGYYGSNIRCYDGKLGRHMETGG
jgi:hypothetical protein